MRKSLAEQEAQLRSPPESPGQRDVRVPQKPDVSQRHESVMREPVTLRGVQGSSASGTSSGVAPPGPLGSGSLRPPSDIHKVPCQSAEQAALENTQRWLDEVASKAKAEHANTSLAGVASSSLQARISALDAMIKGRQAAKIEESPMAGTVASSSAPGTGGRVASEAVLIAGPPPMAAPDWAPDAEDEVAKQKI